MQKQLNDNENLRVRSLFEKLIRKYFRDTKATPDEYDVKVAKNK